jgi:hypothetical protein
MRAVRRITAAQVPEKQPESIGLNALFAYRDIKHRQITTGITQRGGATVQITTCLPICHCFMQHCS